MGSVQEESPYKSFRNGFCVRFPKMSKDYQTFTKIFKVNSSILDISLERLE